jgi:hypothetical protein
MLSVSSPLSWACDHIRAQPGAGTPPRSPEASNTHDHAHHLTLASNMHGGQPSTDIDRDMSVIVQGQQNLISKTRSSATTWH